MSMTTCECRSPQEQRLYDRIEGKEDKFRKTHARVFKLLERFDGQKPRIDIERALYFTQSMKETEGQPLVLRWAKALMHIAENISVCVQEDQLLLGEGLMAAPVYVQNAHGRHVYLPEPMKLLRLRAVDDYDEEILPAGHHYIRCALDEVLLFLRPGHIVPVAQPANNTSELDDASLTLWSFLPDGESAEYRMYRDDGVTTEYEKKEHWKTLQIHHS